MPRGFQVPTGLPIPALWSSDRGHIHQEPRTELASDRSRAIAPGCNMRQRLVLDSEADSSRRVGKTKQICSSRSPCFILSRQNPASGFFSFHLLLSNNLTGLPSHYKAHPFSLISLPGCREEQQMHLLQQQLQACTKHTVPGVRLPLRTLLEEMANFAIHTWATNAKEFAIISDEILHCLKSSRWNSPLIDFWSVKKLCRERGDISHTPVLSRLRALFSPLFPLSPENQHDTEESSKEDTAEVINNT